MDDARLLLGEVRHYHSEAVEMSEPWPVSWSGVWVGTLAALAVGLLIGLIGLSLGATQATPRRLVSWSTFPFVSLILAVAGAFFSFVVGGWAAAKVAGVLRAETAILHGAIVWLVAVPLLLVMATLGAAAFIGEWYSGLAGTPSWVTTSSARATPMDAEGARATRNAARGALTALLIGLMGSVIGGWMGSGEPMTFRPRRQLNARTSELESSALTSKLG
jgi:hypothetical protein